MTHTLLTHAHLGVFMFFANSTSESLCDRAFESLMFTWFPGIRLPVLTADTQIFLWYRVVLHFNGSVRNQVHVEQIKQSFQ